MLPDLVEEDDAVPDDHAHDGQHADDGHEAQRLARHGQCEEAPDEPQRAGHRRDGHEAELLQLKHQDGQHDEDHHRHRRQDLGEGVLAPLERAVRLESVPRRQGLPEVLQRLFIDLPRDGIGLAAVRHIRAERHAREGIPPPDRGDLAVIGNVRDIPESHIAAAARIDRQGGQARQMVRRRTLQPEGHRHQLIPLIGFGDAVARELRIEVLRHRVIVDAEGAHLVLVDGEPHDGRRLRPVQARIGHLRMGLHERQRLLGQRGRDCRIRAAEAEHHRVFRRRPGGDEPHVGLRLRIVRGDHGGELLLQGVPAVRTVRGDDHLSVAVLRRKRVEKQDEPRRRIADIRRKGRHPPVAVKMVLDAAHDALRVPDGRAARQIHVEDELRPHRRREKFLMDERIGAERRCKEAERPGDDRLPVMHGPADGPVEKGIGLLMEGMLPRRRLFHADQAVPQHGGNEDRREPRQDERPCDDPEQGARVFRSLPLGQRHRQEARRGDERPCQHGERARLVCPLCRLHAVRSLLELHLHHLDDDDRVIHEKPQRYDERAQRHDMEVDALVRHEEEGRAHHHGHAQGEHQSAPEPQREEAHRHDDHQCFHERLREFPDGVVHHLRLVRHELHGEPRREVPLHFLRRSGEIFPQLQVVPAGRHGHRHAHCRTAVEIHERRLRVRIGLRHRRHIPQPEGPLTHVDGNGPDGLRRGEQPRHADGHVPRIRVDHAGGHHEALLPDDLEYISGAHPEGGQLVLVHFHIDGLLLHAQELHLLHILDAEHPLPERLRISPLLLVGKAVPRDRVDGAVHIIEAVVDDGPDHTGGHSAPHVGHHVPHVMPPGLHLVRRHAVLQIHIDDGFAVVGEGLEVIQPAGVLQLLFQRIRHLLGDLLRRSARPGGGDHHLADGEIRVLAPSQMEIGPDAADEDGDDEEIDDLLMADGPFRQIHAFHVRTSSPSVRRCVPAVMITSPFCRPPVISTTSFP